jgi:uncharacterized membrane protein YbjE (DUF340 family)
VLDSLVQQALAIAKYVVPIVLGYAAGWALKRRPPGFLFTAVVVVLVFFVAANAAAVVLRNIGVFLALSILYSLALVFITAVLGSFLNKPEAVGAARRPVISLYVAAALAAGLAVGASAEFNYASAIDPLLLFLLFIAGADMAHVEVRLDRSVFLAPAVAFLGAFHGRSYGSMSVIASKPVHGRHFSPLVPIVLHAPYPRPVHCPYPPSGKKRELQTLDLDVLKLTPKSRFDVACDLSA